MNDVSLQSRADKVPEKERNCKKTIDNGRVVT